MNPRLFLAGKAFIPVCFSASFLFAQVSDKDRAAVASQIPGRDLSVYPPSVSSMFKFPVKANADGNARLEVRFKETLPSTLKIILDGKVKLLRDDGLGEDPRSGDGIYCTRVQETFPTTQTALPRASSSDLVSMSALERGGTPIAPSSAASSPAAATAATVSVMAATAVNPAYLVDPEKALFIRTPVVLDHYYRATDPCSDPVPPPGGQPPADEFRKWGFGYLMTQMANESVTKVSASQFALNWLDQWAKNQTVNGYPSKEQDPEGRGVLLAPTIKSQWLKASEKYVAKGTLSMKVAPFRLLAIVNRFDKRTNTAFGGGSAGELRFVFSVLDLTHHDCKDDNTTKLPTCTPINIVSSLGDCGGRSAVNNVILEYAVDKADANAIKAWATKWKDLNALNNTTSQYREALEAITESVVKAGVGGTKRANASALVALRTNESTDNAIWDLREFRIDAAKHYPVSTTISQNPDQGLNNNPNQTFSSAAGIPNADKGNDLTSYLSLFRQSVQQEKNVIPATFKETGYSGWEHVYFLGNHASTMAPYWDAKFNPGFDEETRFHFAINTCNGCHASERTGTLIGAMHVQGRTWGTPAQLSGFLLGNSEDGNATADPYIMSDPKTGKERPVAELERRRQDLAAYLTNGTGVSSLAFQPLTQTH